MLVYQSIGLGTFLSLCFCCSSIAQDPSDEAPPLSAETIIQKAVERAGNHHVPTARPDYTYTKLNVTEELDGKGMVKERKERVFEVHFQAGVTWVKLLEVDGHAPDHGDLKLQAETQSSIHRFLGQSASKGDNRENFLTPELVARFDFSLLGQCSFNGRTTYQVHFQPKTPQPPVRRILDRLLNQVSGTLWIDGEEYEIARADLQLGSEVDFLGGVIGCLRKLAYTMTRTRMADGVWLHSVSSGDFEGRKLLDSMRIKMRSESTNFRIMAAAK
jgi:hypothetical protein